MTGSWTTGGADLEALREGLVALPPFAHVAADDLEPLRTRGLNHAHVRIRGAGALLRVPRLSAYGFDPARNIAYQAACFARAGPCGAVPSLFGAIEPSKGAPWGALVVREIAGDAPVLPDDLPRIARSLAAMHELAVPDDPAPLLRHRDPVRATVDVIEAQAAYLDRAGIHPDAARQLSEELAWARACGAGLPDHPVTLAGTDTHPGNFVVDGDGAAIFVDLEKMVYGSPAIDLAHASVYTSTMWDCGVALAREQASAFYAAYFSTVPAALGDRIRPWCAAMRRLTWLRTTTWCAKWRVEAGWSPAGRDPDYVKTVRERIADYFDPATIERIRAEFLADP